MFVLIRWNEQFEGDEDGLLQECSQCELIGGGEFVIKNVYGPYDTAEEAKAARPKELDGDTCEVVEVEKDEIAVH